ncbi:mannonate dehydratase [uncultured Roseobacter sp.]|uniref:mannonate dehydratase n=1 Tax=uncultured Roseobacter sp. TaxID=114847 RepID=UPI00260D9F7C|nr:mannonate dehydratase [uncultured Roseobacter sp.]
MEQTWRWFGPDDTVTLPDVQQAGATGIVTALHHLPNGVVWSIDEIRQRQDYIQRHARPTDPALSWRVVESLPVTEDIKRQSGDWKVHIAHYKESLANLARCGVSVVCYNFMPVLDWTRTDLRHERPNGARCMRFDVVDFAAFDLFILARQTAEADYDAEVRAAAQRRFAAMDQADQHRLAATVISGLPGAEEGYSLASLQEQLDLYRHIDAARLRANQIDFLSQVVPVAEAHGIRLCCHPDDPPFPLLGLPRIMSTETDYQALITTVDASANGITFCTGSLGVRADNDLPGMIDRLGDRIHFVHLRNVTRESEALPNSFHEAAHLEGATDMVAVIDALLREEQRRAEAGRADISIPFRPDHGQDIMTDLRATSQPGYPAVGRMKGLAELRGIIHALSH